MNIEALKALREAAEKQWNELQDELKRLQGEHRILTKLIDEWVEPSKVKESKNASNTTR